MTAEDRGNKAVAVASSEVRTSEFEAATRSMRMGSRGVPAGRMTTATAIYRELHAAIVAMEMTPGTALNEKVLTERFGVSRTPVREALIRLVEDGLVDVFPQSGTFVARIPVALIPEAVVIRQALEGATVERAAAIATPKDVEWLDEILARQRFLADRQNMSAFHEADEAFHEAIAGVSGHPGIWHYLKPVKVQIDRARRMTLPGLGRMEQVLSEHQVIRDAIGAHDVPAACAAMKQHLNAVIPDIETLRKSHPGSFV
ncbi:GntR family transcriptional regulator [Phyllobacterium endophyticum]|jgi:GntR family transcriptional regulator, rspAB operon transcriptional repressor|uniref:GntR family transcriptional regulator n=1 Tax=Phyllobacterium endophyticum TaxID=1149773 RepID=A0A2P7AZB4_9HYPH|nr:GntR family transcriptional regulator [Phyllobacterium endophyticum]MBB3235842.1 DNA-binding GntR family transcriptional regulator [Phyllobacterium endophyticum]PSH59566.1 GntR family transcriptional regulator [Phyllobacterium endophyticum]TXR50171.1 GntR family transcriptional regulator [Phyllobacterium endophyticum]TYR41704.1 GntR family transcriptional regulator [Phyllobacterium endophyticum]